MQVLTNQVRKEPAQPGEKVMLPNDPEIGTSKVRMKNGIPIDCSTLDKLLELSQEFSIELKINN